MTNGEHYSKEILAIVREHGTFCVDLDGHLHPCDDFDCDLCRFSNYNNSDEVETCSCRIAKWWDTPYDELTEWRNIPIDTPILVRNSREDEWRKQYFAGLNEHSQYYKFKAWNYGATSWSHGNDAPVSWQYAKLANQEKRED